MTLKEVLIAASTFAVFVRADEVAPTEVCNVVMSIQGFLLLVCLRQHCPIRERNKRRITDLKSFPQPSTLQTQSRPTSPPRRRFRGGSFSFSDAEP